MLAKIRELPWRLLAYVATRYCVTEWLIERAQRHIYSHIYHDGHLYMGRWWLFNPYGKGPSGEVLPPKWTWLPSVRLHHIASHDTGRHLHDHPWNARTIILKGWYLERLVDGSCHMRERGYTGRLLFGQYHSVDMICLPGGAWTLFFTWKYAGTWGFLVDGRKVPHREYDREGVEA
jgi:hypothetical protein